MRIFLALIGLLLFCAALIFVFRNRKGLVVKKINLNKEIVLPAPTYDSKVSIEHVLRTRRSMRNYKNKPITLQQLSQLLWAAQGITDAQGLRTAPSAGALYPMEIYVIAGMVDGLDSGVYKYDYRNHKLILVKDGDFRKKLASASLGQSCVSAGAADIVITGIYERTSRKYGSRAQRYVHMEAGHVSQNIYLQAAALGLGTVSVGAFEDKSVQQVIGAQADEEPLYVMPVGVI